MRCLFKNILLSALAILPMLAASCGGDGGKSGYTAPPKLVVKTNPVSSEAGSQFASVTSAGEWTIVSSAGWVSANPPSGKGTRDIVLSYSENTGDARSAELTITNPGGSFKLTFTQKANGEIPGPGPEVIPAGDFKAKSTSAKWLELPETSETDAFDFCYHGMMIGGTKTRNYSFYWDYQNLVANWVAYPLNAWNIGKGERTNAWGYDPLLPASSQQDVSGGYREGNNGWYSRGHQIPSADRLEYSANVTTFYGTNMTPQDNDFNGGIWAALEGYVRSWAAKSDTLYVVTGCVTEGAKYYAFDRAGRKITVPTHYFKAVLRYSTNTTVGYQNFMAAGFWFDHEADKTAKFSKTYSLSVADLEKKLGYKLFVNLDAKVGAGTARKIKEENPATVNWWW